jgi:hypothetical protein
MLGSLWRVVGVRQPLRAVREQISEFKLTEARQRQVEAADLQFAELEAEEFAVPSSVKRQLIVGAAVSLDLRVRPPTRHHRRHVGNA